MRTMTRVEGPVSGFAWLCPSGMANHALVFVHGFAGHPIRTWAEMRRLMLSDPTLLNTDLLFLGYDSIRPKVAENGNELARFLETLRGAPDLRIAFAGDETAYRTITCVAHSEGGLVLRYAISLLAQASTSLPGLARFERPRLLAPAIGGRSETGLLGAVKRLSSLSDVVAAFSGAYWSMSSSSQLLGATRARTELLAAEHPQVLAFRSAILWAHRDQVVEPGTGYLYDAEDFAEVGTTHQSVCRPATREQKAYLLVVGSQEVLFHEPSAEHDPVSP